MQRIDTQLKKKIMKRIYFAYFLRKVFNPFTMKIYALISFAGVLASQVSLVNVIANMPSATNVGALFRFYVSAFLNTEFAVQLLSVGALVAISLLFKDIVKTYSTYTPAAI